MKKYINGVAICTTFAVSMTFPMDHPACFAPAKSKVLEGKQEQTIESLLIENCLSADGMTSLHRAIRTNSYELIQRALSSGVDANALDSKGKSPMHYAVEMKDPVEIVNLIDILIAHGASVLQEDAQGKITQECTHNQLIKSYLAQCTDKELLKKCPVSRHIIMTPLAVLPRFVAYGEDEIAPCKPKLRIKITFNKGNIPLVKDSQKAPEFQGAALESVAPQQKEMKEVDKKLLATAIVLKNYAQETQPEVVREASSDSEVQEKEAGQASHKRKRRRIFQ